MTWTAIVPLKSEPLRKSRLAAALRLEQRIRLSAALHRHVTNCIQRTGLFSDSITLSPTPPTDGVPSRWQSDDGMEVNAALARLRAATPGPLMVINSDLPLLRPDDLKSLAAAAEVSGCAIAADRHGLGTNAVAIMPGTSFTFAFGADSLKAHVQAAQGKARVVRRIGLGYDVDTMEDIAAVIGTNRTLPPDVADCLKPSSDT